ncbi:hypothetical protein AVEN_264124-1 [Araneus ventricosus]|uniref:Uncharacterized protein n=1 Tax=Araneus ventricosus TaxID=182803 RepID=A0A4Y2RZI3_ARAVE|nr:hypothetical protein AVEN_264124-1 [Araneus ventricosus]
MSPKGEGRGIAGWRVWRPWNSSSACNPPHEDMEIVMPCDGKMVLATIMHEPDVCFFVASTSCISIFECYVPIEILIGRIVGLRVFYLIVNISLIILQIFRIVNPLYERYI